MKNSVKTFMLTVAVLALSSGTVQAADANNDWYLSFGAGWNHAQDEKFKADGVKDKVSFDEGWVGDVAIGRAWGRNLRTELEGSYRYNGVDKISGSGASGSTGNFHSWNAMVNQYYDFHTNSPWMPYVGAGIGASFQKANNIGNTFVAANNISGWDTQFAYQGIVGVDYWATSRSAIGLRYNYFATTQGKYDTSSAAVGKASGENQNQAVLVTYRINLGSDPKPAETKSMSTMPTEAAPAPVAAQPTAYTAPTEQAIEDSPYKIFFANDVSKLNAAGHKVVAEAAAAAGTEHSVVLHITSNTDTMGTNAHNDKLSAARATTVRKALIAQGISPDKINVVSNAERDLPVPTNDQVREPRNRVVTIVLQ